MRITEQRSPVCKISNRYFALLKPQMNMHLQLSLGKLRTYLIYMSNHHLERMELAHMKSVTLTADKHFQFSSPQLCAQELLVYNKRDETRKIYTDDYLLNFWKPHYGTILFISLPAPTDYLKTFFCLFVLYFLKFVL